MKGIRVVQMKGHDPLQERSLGKSEYTCIDTKVFSREPHSQMLQNFTQILGDGNSYFFFSNEEPHPLPRVYVSESILLENALTCLTQFDT